jgi:tRNA pseudouridine38-40 synthase
VIVRFELAYHGAAFHGWQIQPNVRTVQGEVHVALSKFLQTEVWTGGASRTDAGVHAMGQVVSFPWPDGVRYMSPHEVQRALHAFLPVDTSVTRLEFTTACDHNDRPFHARHCARGKRYRYHVWFGRIRHPFLSDRTWQCRRTPSQEGWDNMAKAAAMLVGEHEFAGFRASDCTATKTVRRLDRVQWLQGSGGPHHFELVVQGTAFLKNMVRIITGTLLDVGYGRLELDRIPEILATGDRTLAGRTAPPHGLILEEVFYPDFPWAEETWTLSNRV